MRKLQVPHLPTGKEDGNAGAPEPKKTDTEYRIAAWGQPLASTLGKQVRFCEQAVGLTWFDDEIDAVTRYLNQGFYHFE